jgi:hypothetical protein
MLLLAQQNLVLDKLCQAILDSKKEICFVGITNERGNVLEKKQRDSLVGQLQKTRYEMFFMEFALQQRMNNEFDFELGPVLHTIIQRENETFFSFPLNGLQVLVVAKNGCNPVSVSKKITQIIDKYYTEFDSQTGKEMHKVLT